MREFSETERKAARIVLAAKALSSFRTALPESGISANRSINMVLPAPTPHLSALVVDGFVNDDGQPEQAAATGAIRNSSLLDALGQAVTCPSGVYLLAGHLRIALLPWPSVSGIVRKDQ
ncbi:MAG: hypothetical protein CME86_20845 [Herbaspirillum sp.]|nr:hypothetical protein [Herbaspirillum sp.]